MEFRTGIGHRRLSDDQATQRTMEPQKQDAAVVNRRQLGAGTLAAVVSLSAAGGLPIAPRAAAANSAQVSMIDGRAARVNVGEPDKPLSKCRVRVAAVSYTMPFHDHHKLGVDIRPLREMVRRVTKDRPDFICFPEIAGTYGRGLAKDMEGAVALEPYVAEVAKIAREFNVAIVAPVLERDGSRIYNSAPIINRIGELVLNYRKNFLTVYEMEHGVSPGVEVPVALCDGVRVGASICYDANFDSVAAELERQRARLMFWPSMYWGGQILQHWALRYGFSIAVAYNSESAIIDMSGRYLARQGQETLQVRAGHLPPWAVADIHVNRDLFHIDTNQNKFAAMHEKYGSDIHIEVREPEGYFLLASNLPELPVETLAAEFQLETNRDFLARSVRMRSAILAKQ